MKTKYHRPRILIIDRELSKNDFVKTIDLVRIIKTEVDILITQRQIQKDIELMKEDPPLGHAAPIDYDHKKKAYFYTDPDFTIQAFGLKNEDVLALFFYARTLEQHKGIKIFEDILKAIEKVIDNVSISKTTKELIANRTLLQTEKIPKIKGIEFIEPIIKAIIQKQKISFDYKKFADSDVQKRILEPLLLKEDRNFWYVIGFFEEKDSPTTFALDRISNLIVTNKYFESKLFDTEEYFKYSFGITVPVNKPIKIILSFNSFQGNYIKSLPIHETQEIIKDNKKELRISIKVKPSYEFYSKILSYGEHVRVISPKSIAYEISNRLKIAYRQYS